MSTVCRVVFVCMGNICRSPTAHAVFRDRVRVDSAGTHDYHAGEPPDPRSQRHALRRGHDLSALRARALRPDDLIEADLLIVMDAANQAEVRRRCPPEHHHKLLLLGSFCRDPVHRGQPVPDPWAGGAAGFEQVLDMVEDACDGLLDHVRERLAGVGPNGAPP